MKPRPKDVALAAFKREAVAEEARGIRKNIHAWTSPLPLPLPEPVLPNGLADRPAEIWAPLLQIAEAAGPSWATHIRAASLAAQGVTGVTASGGKEKAAVLRVLQQAFHTSGLTQIPTGLLMEMIKEQEDPYIGDIDARRLAEKLAPYEIQSIQFRVPGETNPRRGYRLLDCQEAFDLYL